MARPGEAAVNRLDREKIYLKDLLGPVRVQPGSFTFGSKPGKIPLTLATASRRRSSWCYGSSPQTRGCGSARRPSRRPSARTRRSR